MEEKAKLASACEFTAGSYGNCLGCYCADQCPTWQGTSPERAMVHPSDPYTVVTVG